MKSVIQKVTSVTSGFGKVYADCKTLYGLKGKVLNRRERELARVTEATVRKVGVLFILQLPPVIGLLPIALALTYPKQILTSHFWTEEQRKQYREEDWEETIKYAQMSMKDVNSVYLSTKSDVSSAFSADMTELTSDDFGRLRTWQKLFLDTKYHVSIAPEDLKTLSRSLLSSGIDALDNATPVSLVRHWMASRAKEIISDDLLLIKEGINDLSTDEMRLIAMRRGFSPYQTDVQFKDTIDKWLSEQITHDERQAFLSESDRDLQLLNITSLFYLKAYNSSSGNRFHKPRALAP